MSGNKIRHKIYVLTIIAGFFLPSGKSQDFTHRKLNYRWEDHVAVDIEVAPQFQQEDAVILYEEVMIDASRGFIKTYSRIKFLTWEGIRKFNGVTLPKANSAFHYLYQTAEVSRGDYPVYFGGEEDLRLFASRIIRHKTIIESNVKETAISYLPWGDRTQEAFAYRFDFVELQPGDELEWVYSYKMSRDFIYYLQDIFPKQECILVIKEEAPFHTYIKYYNGKDSIVTETRKEKNNNRYDYKIHTLEVKDLPGISFRENQPAAGLLPYLVIYPYRLDGKVAPYFFNREIPPARLNWPMIYAGFTSDDKKDDLENIMSYANRETNVTNDFFSTFQHLPYPHSLYGLHHYITDSFTLLVDSSVFWVDKTMKKLPSYADALENHILRMSLTGKLYHQLVMRYGRPYFMIPLQDKRYYTIRDSVFQPLIWKDIAFGIYDDAGFLDYVFPPSGRGRYYANEFPFYYEGVKQVHVPQSIPYRQWIDRPYDAFFPVLNIPAASEAVNYRKIAAVIEYNESGKDSVVGKILLSGQYSTMNRGAYLYEEKDSSVNEKYALRWGNLDPEVFQHFSQLRETPFSAGFQTETATDQFIIKRDSLYVIPLKYLFPAVFTKGFSAVGYPYGYQPDFAGKDDISIKIHFPFLVEEVIPGKYAFYKENEDMLLRFSVTRAQDQSLDILFQFKLAATYMGPEKMGKLEEIFRQLEWLESGELILRRVD